MKRYEGIQRHEECCKRYKIATKKVSIGLACEADHVLIYKRRQSVQKPRDSPVYTKAIDRPSISLPPGAEADTSKSKNTSDES